MNWNAERAFDAASTQPNGIAAVDGAALFAADNSMKREKRLFEPPKQGFAFLKASDVVSMSE